MLISLYQENTISGMTELKQRLLRERSLSRIRTVRIRTNKFRMNCFIIKSLLVCFYRSQTKMDYKKNKFQISLKKIMSVGNSGILVYILCGQLSAYPSLCRGLKYSLKVRLLILLYLTWQIFLFSRPFFLSIRHQCPMSENISQT